MARKKKWKPIGVRRIRGTGGAFVRNRRHLETFERAIIVRDILALGGEASARQLNRQYPMRYNMRYLPNALAHMARTMNLIRMGGPRRLDRHQRLESAIYGLHEAQKRRAA